MIGAYSLLRRKGLRVTVDEPGTSYPKQLSLWSLHVPGAHLDPPAGTRVHLGSTVAISPDFGPQGSPAVLKSDPHYRVPDFTGQPLSEAVSWANHHTMFWAVPALPSLCSSTAPRLFTAYRITAQRPLPGEVISQGHRQGRGFTPTPLALTVKPA
jgi:hypothetical protein